LERLGEFLQKSNSIPQVNYFFLNAWVIIFAKILLGFPGDFFRKNFFKNCLPGTLPAGPDPGAGRVRNRTKPDKTGQNRNI